MIERTTQVRLSKINVIYTSGLAILTIGSPFLTLNNTVYQCYESKTRYDKFG